MFTIPSFMSAFIMNKIDDEGDNGGGTEVENQPDEFGVPYVEPSVEDNTDTGNAEIPEGDSGPKISPAWEKVLNTLPKEFHSQVVPEFDAWDKNFAKVQSDYAPYKPLLENNVSMEDIQSSIQLAKWVSADPQAVYNELGRRFGFGKEQGQPQVEDDSDNEEDIVDLSQEEQNPQLVQLQQTVQSLQQMIQNQETQKQESQIRDNAAREIQNEWSQLESSIKQPLSPDVRKEIIRRAVAIGDENGGAYSLTEGYKDYAQFVNRVRNSRANNTAPAVLPGNGGLPVTKKNFGQMDEDERVNYIASMAKGLNEGN